MNQSIMKAMGYSNEVEMVNEGICPMCRIPIKMDSFRDNASRKEYNISGLCQNCQDTVFK